MWLFNVYRNIMGNPLIFGNFQILFCDGFFLFILFIYLFFWGGGGGGVLKQSLINEKL